MILFSNFRNVQTMSRPMCCGAQALFNVEKEIQETSIFKGHLMLLVSLLLPQILHDDSVWSFDPPSFVISLAKFVSQDYCFSLFHLPSIIHAFQLATNRLKCKSPLSHGNNNKVHEDCIPVSMGIRALL